MYNSYRVHRVTIAITVTQIPTNRFSLHLTITSPSFKRKSFTPLSTTSFSVFLDLPLCLTVNLQSSTFLLNHHRQTFLKHIHTITV